MSKSNKKTLENITPAQIKAKGVVSLADRPNVSSSYGVGGLSATNLKLWFDKLATFLADKINEIQNVLNSYNESEDGVYGSDYIGIPPLNDDILCLTDLVNAITSGDFATLLMAYASESDTELTDTQSIINGFAKQIADLEETVGLIYYGAYSTTDTLKVGYTASSKMTALSMNEAVKAGYYFLLFWTDTSTNTDYLCACLATAVADSTVTWQVVSYVRLTGAKGSKGDSGNDGEDGNGIASIKKTGTLGLVDTYTIYYTNGTTDTFTVTNGKDGDNGKDDNGIEKIEKTDTDGNVDTYTIYYTNGDTDTFTVTNADDDAIVEKVLDILEPKAGGSLALTLDNATFVITATLYAIDGTALSTSSVDLPLESVVVDGDYDSENKTVILTLQNGNTVVFSVADLIDGLVTTSEFETAKSTLQNNIDTVGNNLSTEISDRQNADTALENRVETAENNIDTVGNNLSTEISDRQNADTALEDRVETAENNIAELQELLAAFTAITTEEIDALFA